MIHVLARTAKAMSFAAPSKAALVKKCAPLVPLAKSVWTASAKKIHAMASNVHKANLVKMAPVSPTHASRRAVHSYAVTNACANKMVAQMTPVLG
jgi:hypothetical protein